MVVLYQTWPTSVYTNLLMQKSIPLTEGDKESLEKFREDVVGDSSIVFPRKAVVDEVFIKKSKSSCKSIVGIDTSQLQHFRCVIPCQPVLIRLGISIHRRVDLRVDETRPAILKIWSCPIRNEQDQNVKLKASLQQADRRKLTA